MEIITLVGDGDATKVADVDEGADENEEDCDDGIRLDDNYMHDNSNNVNNSFIFVFFPKLFEINNSFY